MSGGGSSTSKGNPAHTRMSNPKLAARRERSWKRSQASKIVRRQEQQARENKNREIRSKGSLTPWQNSQQLRAEARKPLRELWLRQHREDILSAS
jgi:hypothetical protein